MKQQFLRVYIGIALVLLLAALATAFFAERELKSAIDRRTEDMMVPLARRIHRGFSEAAVDEERREHIIERLGRNYPVSIKLLPPDSLSLSSEDHNRLAAGEHVYVRENKERAVYTRINDTETLVIRTERGTFRRFGRRGPGRGPPNQLGPRSYFLVGVLVAILALIGASVYLLLRPYERRIYALSDVARNFGQGDLHSRAAEERGDAIAELGQTFNWMAGRIEGLIDDQKELLRAVSHELRTPLAKLFFILDDAQMSPSLEEKNKNLGRIEGTLGELNELVEELLAFIRLEGESDQKLARQPIDLAQLIDEVGDTGRQLGRQLQVDCRAEATSFAGDQRLLKRAVLNLVTNAVRHAEKRLLIACSAHEAEIHIFVEDDGPGIPSQMRSKIFEPFVRLDQSRTADTGGTGLGLAIVQRIVQRHGGCVNVEDSSLGGARFVMVLPTNL